MRGNPTDYLTTLGEYRSLPHDQKMTRILSHAISDERDSVSVLLEVRRLWALLNTWHECPAPAGKRVLAGRWTSEGDWFEAVVFEPGKPFTHWRWLPPPPTKEP